MKEISKKSDRRSRWLLLLVISVYGFPGPALAAPNPDYAAVLDKIEDYVDSHPGVSINYSLVHEGKSILSGGYGVNGQGRGKVYRGGSLTKILTTLGILHMEKQGLIDIDQPLYAYLPRFYIKRRFADKRPITIRHVLTHHSGMPTNIVKGQWSDAHFSTVVEQLRNEYLTYPPDFVMAYSNISFSVLGAMIEEVSGQSYESYIKEAVLDPLGMGATGFDVNVVHSSQFVPAYSSSGNASLPAIRDTPALGMYTTADDMAKLLIMLTSRGVYEGTQVVDVEQIEEMMEHQNHHVVLDYDNQVGLGLVLNHCKFDQPGKVIEHGGRTMYYSSHFVAIPSFNTGAIVLSNSREAKSIVHKLANELTATALGLHLSEKEIIEKEIVVDDSVRMPQVSSARSGKYLTKSGLLTLQVDDEDLCACVGDKKLNLIPAPDGWYEFERKINTDASPVKITSHQVAGKDVLVISKDGDEQRLGEYVPETSISDTWVKRLGNYEVSNPDADFPLTEVCLTKEDDLLYFSYRMPRLTNKRINLPLTVLDQEQAITSGMGRGRGETLAAMQTDKGEFLFYSGYLVKKLPDAEENIFE